MNYGLAYALGFHPWEDLADYPPFADKLLELVAREEDGHGPHYGSALDLGTGSAVWGVELARRGGPCRYHEPGGRAEAKPEEDRHDR